MKRKFSFLAPLRIPSRAETRALRERIESQLQDVPSPLTPPLSAFINRRELDQRTEAQLRAACTAVVKGEVIQESVLTIYRPAHAKSVPHLTKHIGPEADRPRTTSRPQRQQDPDVPALPVVENRVLPVSRSVQDFRARNGLPKLQTALGTQVTRPSISDSTPATATSLRTSNTFSPTTVYRKPVPIEESDGSYATPRTASTDQYHGAGSTGFTSTAITPSHPLGRVSGQLLPENANPKPKSALRGSSEQSEPVSHQRREQRPPPPAETPQRPSSRSRFRDWAFHRPSSRGSQRPNTAVEQPQLRRAASTERMNGKSARSSGGQPHGGFTLHDRLSQINLTRPRRSSSRGSARPSIEGTHFDIDRSTPDLNLNRPLPRLPALDTWDKQNKSAQADEEETPVSATKMHVVDLMKATAPAKRASPPAAAAAPMHIHHFAKEISIPPPLHQNKEISIAHTNTATTRSHEISPMTHSRSTSTADSCFSPISNARSLAPSEHVRSPTSNNGSNATGAAKHTRVLSDAPSTAYSATSRPSCTLYAGFGGDSRAVSSLSNSTVDGAVPNFSRKISIDSHGGIRSGDVTALPPMPSTAQKPRGLRKVLSSLQVHVKVGKKSEAVNWMERFEREGIRKGVLVERGGGGAAAAPIVRY